tara:strand:+ start:1630 stop:2547 length:918 start_codon:yes stop_codon:yes gene_type:complete
MALLSEDYPMWKSKIEYLEKNITEYNIILGDSRAVAGFAPKEYNERYYNFALGAGTPIESYFILKRLLDKKTPKKVIISFSPLHFFQHQAFYDFTLNFNFFQEYKELVEVLNLAFKYNDIFFKNDLNKSNDLSNIYKFKTYSEALCYYFNILPIKLPELKTLIYMPTTFISNKLVYEKITNNKGQHFYGTLNTSNGKNRESALDTFIPSPVLSHYFIQILELAKDNNIKVYYISTPFNKSSYQQTSEQYIKGYNNYIEKIKTHYPEVYWNEELYHYPDSCFGDASHVNEKGAYLFNKKVISIITE